MTLLLVAQGGVDPNDVTPGVVGFLATFALVLVSILLFLNMNRRLRRMRHRQQQDADRRDPDERRPDDRRPDDRRPDDRPRHEPPPEGRRPS